MTDSSLGEGQVLHGTYRIARCIAKGGMGIVYEATHLRLPQKRFAIKVLNPAVLENPSVYARFRREAEIVSALGHPHIIYVVDFNELEGGQPYMVMELLEGEDLKQRLHRVRRLPAEQVKRMVEQVGSALQLVHDKGIVHRDLKPSNLFLVATPSEEIHVKILDFGISKVWHSKSVVTRDQTLMGTPYYMAPEQAKGSVADIDHRTDIFALATIVYLALTGELPFDAPTIPGVLFNICYEAPRPVLELLPDLPAHVQDVLARAMAKRKEDRYHRVEDFVSELRLALDELPLAEEKTVPRAAQTLPPTEPLSVPDLATPLTMPGTPRGAPSPEAAPPLSARPLPEAVDAMESQPSTLSRAAGELQPATQRKPLLLVGAAVALLILAGGALVGRSLVPSRPAAPKQSAGPSSALVVTPPAAARAPERAAVPDARQAPDQGVVHVKLTLSPPNATLRLDGENRADNPLTLSPSDEEHVLKVEADGHTPRVVRFVAQRDLSLDIKLRARKQARPARTPSVEPRANKASKKKGMKLYDDI